MEWQTKSHTGTAQWGVGYQVWPNWLFRKGWWNKKLDAWGVVNNKGCSSIQSLLKGGGATKLKKFYLVSLGQAKFYFLKYKKVQFPEISRIFWGGFHFPKNKKSFLLRKYKKFFNFRARTFHFQKFWKIKEFFLREDFLFSKLWLKTCAK